ncbi:MAG: hypothetical protein II584_04545 [Treponema sp.]|nr:hypothetical protein [Treponema sp.]
MSKRKEPGIWVTTEKLCSGYSRARLSKQSDLLGLMLMTVSVPEKTFELLL